MSKLCRRSLTQALPSSSPLVRWVSGKADYNEKYLHASSAYLVSPECDTAGVNAYNEECMQLCTPPTHTEITGSTGTGTKKKNMLEFDPSEMKSCYKMMTSGVTPRPIALVSTVDPDTQVVNVAPFSFFGAMCHDPPLITIGVIGSADPTDCKDTLRNIHATGELVVSIVGEDYVVKANVCSGNFAADVSELDAAGLHSAPSTAVAAPRVADAKFAMECRVHSIVPIAKPGSECSTSNDCEPNNVTSPGPIAFDYGVMPTAQDAKNTSVSIIIAQVVRFQVDEEVWNPEAKEIDPLKLKPISRVHGCAYGTLGNVFPMPRPHGKNITLPVRASANDSD
jgi:flavin reductase (DIM6/NTAB) family NADH-FMN oxidoreductase RutF